MRSVTDRVKAPRSNRTATTGTAKLIKPTMAGTARKIARRRLSRSARFMSPIASRATAVAITGSAPVAIATPTTPMGNCTSRNA